MKARLVVFPIRGRNWCFSRSVESSQSEAHSSNTPSTLKDLWKKISSKSTHSSFNSNLEVVVDFASNKMNRAWSNLEKAPPGSLKNKLHGLGLRLLSRVKPSEIFLKSIPKEVTRVDITYPSSLNGQLVRRRLRHIALRKTRCLKLSQRVHILAALGWDLKSLSAVEEHILNKKRNSLCYWGREYLKGTIIHKKYLYGSVTLLPLTSFFMVLPLPNIPFFWVLFRTYSHWRALQGSENLLRLVTNSSDHQNHQKSDKGTSNKNTNTKEFPQRMTNCISRPWVLLPSEDLQKLIRSGEANDSLSESTISDICQRFNLNTMDVVKYKHSL